MEWERSKRLAWLPGVPGPKGLQNTSSRTRRSSKAVVQELWNRAVNAVRHGITCAKATRCGSIIKLQTGSQDVAHKAKTRKCNKGPSPRACNATTLTNPPRLNIWQRTLKLSMQEVRTRTE